MPKMKKKIPEILKKGFIVYKDADAKKAIAVWSEGSSQHGTYELEEKLKSLRQVEAAHGKYLSYKVKEIQEITPTAQLIFITLSYERSNLSARFMAYKQGQKWIIANFLFDVFVQTTKSFLL